MSTPSSPVHAQAPESPSRVVPDADRSSILNAVQARAATARVQEDQYESEHDARQRFRRLIDPGILRADPAKARPALELLLKLADNIINNPNEEKYRSFKPTNKVIQRDLVEVKGAVEYAVALGFRATVRDFQPYYEWNPKYTDQLRIGADMIREDLERQDKQKVYSQRNLGAEKQAAKEAAEKVKLAYIDDRKKKAEHDRLERERRLRAAASPAPPATPARTTPVSRTQPRIRGEGRTLNGAVEPPPYSPNAHPDDRIAQPSADDAAADDAADEDAEEDAEMSDADDGTELRGGRRLGD
ncbi:hypothetical protein EXIGLDRAFT_827948 [Exidia glandulosa HHB12029]|uniref:PUB domain-containing protein n=1 Tax=Exidia glandulosa HHB12029 TaxID=1314781 RepID=A0A165QSJ9_EXIGL|nr:hypothetical protein EXIGLDRAFT_827948 [Exidia glandulosa HHB12029]